MKLFAIMLLLKTIWAQSNYSENGCYQEGQKAYGDVTKGAKASDLFFLDTLLPSHRLYEFRACEDQMGSIKGLQLTTAIIADKVSAKIKLNAFGSMTPPTCKTYYFAKSEYISKLTFFYSSTKLDGIAFTTIKGGTFQIGKQTSTS